MTDTHDDWHVLAAAWRSGPAAPPPLLADVKRRDRASRRRLALIYASEVLITLGTLGVSVELVRYHFGVVWALWMLLAWTLVAAAWIMAVWQVRGARLPPTGATEAFLTAAVRRCQRRARTARVVLLVVLIQLATLAVTALARYLEAPGLFTGARFLAWAAAAGGLVVAYVGWVLWVRRRVLRELAQLEALRAELDEGGA